MHNVFNACNPGPLQDCGQDATEYWIGRFSFGAVRLKAERLIGSPARVVVVLVVLP